MEFKEMFEDLEVLEKWYKNNIINLEKYFELKSSIVDFYTPKKDKVTGDNMPF